ncbi:MAG: hypothetical protein IPP12_00395 [Nitrospira sp.]|nr:hypothetical protein [Nitrospira sp.]
MQIPSVDNTPLFEAMDKMAAEVPAEEGRRCHQLAIVLVRALRMHTMPACGTRLAPVRKVLTRTAFYEVVPSIPTLVSRSPRRMDPGQHLEPRRTAHGRHEAQA